MMEKKHFKNEAEVKTNLKQEQIHALYDITKKAIHEFGTFIKSVVVFGSFARGNISQKSDSDVLFIVDDSSIDMEPDLINAYELELRKIINEEKSPIKIHVNTIGLSDFFDGLRRGDPLGVNILRDGIPIFDNGFFSPWKRLLTEGKIRPTQEAIEAAEARSYYHLDRFRLMKTNAVNMLYWSVVEAAHAFIMAKEQVPASPYSIPEHLENLGIDEELIETYWTMYKTMKAITKGEKTDVSEEELHTLAKASRIFVEKMAEEIKK